MHPDLIHDGTEDRQLAEPTIISTIWRRRRIAFVLTDRSLVIRGQYGPPEVIVENSEPEKEGLKGRPLIEVFPELLGNEQELKDILAARLPGMKLEYVNREISGKTHYLTMETLPFRDETGSIAGLLHMVQDVTSKGKLEQQVTQNRNQLQLLKEQMEKQNLELVAANTELHQLSDMKTQFISLAAHELRTPLTSLNGYVEMLLDGQMGPLSDRQRQVLKIIEESGRRLVHLTDDMLTATRLEAGRVDLMLRPTDLASLVEAAAAEYAIHFEAKAQTLSIEFGQWLPAALCDAARITQVLTNLLSNANKFTPRGGHITIRVSTTGEPMADKRATQASSSMQKASSGAAANQPGFLLLTIGDTGVGIAAEDLPKIFSRWFRSKSAASQTAQGSGLGLYIAHSLVELHGGSIWAESQPGKGSTFYVTIPAAI